LGVNERMGLKLFGREIIFEQFQPMWSLYLNVTDRRTDRRTDDHTIAKCGSIFSARQHSALYAIARPSVRPSVCLSHGWISQRRLKLGSCNLHHRVAPWP